MNAVAITKTARQRVAGDTRDRLAYHSDAARRPV
jgi:hypothetical protein